MAEYSVIIPVHDMQSRGYERLKWQLLSLHNQTRRPEEAFIALSNDSDIDPISEIIFGPFAIPFDFKLNVLEVDTGQVFNMPKSYNRAIEKVTTEYVFLTGVDFLYRPDTFEKYRQFEGPKEFLLHADFWLPNCTITSDMVNRWKFPKAKKNPWNKGADGLQYMPTQFLWDIGGHDERMSGWGGMDNSLHLRAKRFGMNCKWIAQGSILHQWHKIEKSAKDPDSIRNWEILENDDTVVMDFITLK